VVCDGTEITDHPQANLVEELAAEFGIGHRPPGAAAAITDMRLDSAAIAQGHGGAHFGQCDRVLRAPSTRRKCPPCRHGGPISAGPILVLDAPEV
jgi:hypothetical protein